MTIILHLTPWLPMCLKLLQWCPIYRAEKFSVNFTPFECLDVQHLHVLRYYTINVSIW